MFQPKVPKTAGPYLEAIEGVRRRRGIPILRAARMIGVHRDTWSNMERGLVERPLFDHVAAMADGMGMRFMLVPKGDLEQRAAPNLPRLPSPARPMRERAAGPNLLRIMDRVRAARERAGLTQAQAAARSSVAKSTWGHLERGYVSGRDIGIERVAAAARAVDLTVDAVADHHVPLLELDADEVAKVRGLIRWYRDRAPGSTQFDSIADKLKLDTAA